MISLGAGSCLGFSFQPLLRVQLSVMPLAITYGKVSETPASHLSLRTLQLTSNILKMTNLAVLNKQEC